MAVELFTVKEVAEKLRVKPRTVYRWLKSGRMTGIETPGGQHRIPGEELRREWASRLVSEAEQNTPEPPVAHL